MPGAAGELVLEDLVEVPCVEEARLRVDARLRLQRGHRQGALHERERVRANGTSAGFERHSPTKQTPIPGEHEVGEVLRRVEEPELAVAAAASEMDHRVDEEVVEDDEAERRDGRRDDEARVRAEREVRLERPEDAAGRQDHAADWQMLKLCTVHSRRALSQSGTNWTNGTRCASSGGSSSAAATRNTIETA